LLAGYVLMTILSGGECTLTFGEPFETAASFGFFFYPLALVLFAVVLVVRRILIWRKGRE